MHGPARHLILTADERTWKFDRPVVFLGEWCRRYDRRDAWSRMDAVVADPYGMTQSERDRDLAFVRAFEVSLNDAVAAVLNRFHGTRYSTRFWRILIGHWLRRFIDVVFNRYRTIEQCLERHNIAGASVLACDTYLLATQASEAFIWACSDPVWDNFLCARVLEHVDGGGIPVEKVHVDEGVGFRVESVSTRAPAGLKARLSSSLSSLSRLAVREDDAFILHSYLPKSQELKLQLRLGQMPAVWRSPNVVVTETADAPIRRELAAELSARGSGEAVGVRRCIDALLFDALPICYLEGFGSLQAQHQGLGWPKRPRFIFTCSSSDTDEVFKCWAASQAERGTPLYTGQHGNNYGTHRYLHPSVEESFSDGFFTWGWTSGPEHIPAFVFTTAGKRAVRINPAGGLLLVSMPLGHRISRWDAYADYAAYFEQQQEFVRALRQEHRERLTVRLHSAFRRLQWSDDKRWRDFDPSLRLDTGDTPIQRLIADSRLVVHSYDSTGLLEGLAQNRPTLAFWRNGYEHLCEHAKPWYRLLVDAGIVHFSPASVITQIEVVWSDVLGWWHSSTVQEARRAFCDQYARDSRRPAHDLAHLLSMFRLREWRAVRS